MTRRMLRIALYVVMTGLLLFTLINGVVLRLTI